MEILKSMKFAFFSQKRHAIKNLYKNASFQDFLEARSVDEFMLNVPIMNCLFTSLYIFILKVETV